VKFVSAALEAATKEVIPILQPFEDSALTCKLRKLTAKD
jgi:hypothetical protein